MLIHCIIVDDEPLALDLLEDNIKRVPYLKLIAKCNNAFEAIQLLQSVHVDLVFTDVQMPGLSGLDFAHTSTVKPMFIFNTAHEKYALGSYELDAVDYLLKPVSFERFLQACNKALERFNIRKIIINRTQPGATLYTNAPDHIFLNVDYSMVKIRFDEIKYIEAQKDYAKIHFTSEKRALLVRISMKGLEEVLPSNQFARIHKSYIVNIGLVTAIRKNSVFLSEMEFAISEQYKDVISKITNGNSRL